MREEEILKEITNAIIEFNKGIIEELIMKALDVGIPPYKILMEGLKKGLDIVGKKYEQKEYFLAELIMAAETAKAGLEALSPYLKAEETSQRTGIVVVGTVKGDIHDIGKNIVVTLLSSAGFEVYDLGVDVPAEKFIEKVKETGADILAMSALLTTTMVEMENVIKLLEKEGLRAKVKVVVGGAPLTEEFARKIGADAYAPDALEGLKICKSLVIGGTY